MKVHHVAMTVNNLKKSISFYTKILRFKIDKEFKREDMGASAVFIELSGFKIELWQFLDMKDIDIPLNDIRVRGIRHLAFEVDNLYKVIDRMKNQGLHPSKPKLGASGHNYSFVNDPDGIALEFYEK